MKSVFLVLFFLLVIFVFAGGAYATTFDLLAPSGQLTRGQEVKFTINIDTEGRTLKTTEVGMSYKTEVLQYISTTPGNAFSTVSATAPEGGKILFGGKSEAGFSGSGTFAIVTFKLIATAPGSTELCILFAPGPSPTTPPPATASATPRPPPPPRSGSDSYGKSLGLLAIILLLGAFSLYLLNKKAYYKKN